VYSEIQSDYLSQACKFFTSVMKAEVRDLPSSRWVQTTANISLPAFMPTVTRRDSPPSLFVPDGRIGWRWLVWHQFSHNNCTQRPPHLQLPDFEMPVGASGIFDSHCPLHFPSLLSNASQLDLHITSSATLVDVG
jgi:hypothetical protein